MKKLFAILLALSLLVTLVACGNTQSASSSNPSSSTAEETSSKNVSVAEENSDEEYPVLRFNMTSFTGEIRANADEVIEAINVILREKAHAEIEPVWVTFGDRETQMNLLLSGGEDSLDFFSSGSGLSTLVTNGQVAPLDDLINEYGQDTLSLFEGYEDVLDCARISGQLYGIPSVNAWVAPNYYMVKKEDSDAANIDWSTVHDLDTLTQALVEMKKANPDHYYIPGSTEPYWVPKDVDYLGDQNYLGVLTDPANSSKVENYYESEPFLNLLENVKVWQENGIISPDPMSNSNPTLLALQTGQVSGTTGYNWSIDEVLYESNTANSYNGEMVGAALTPSYLTSGNVTTYLWHITPFCKHPEEAMKVLNLLFTDKEVATLFGAGIEGMTYTLNEDGSASFMEGQDMISSGWTGGGGNYFLPNTTLLPFWDNQNPNVYDMVWEANESGIKSIALGFNCDLDPVADQVSACANVIAQYYLPLMNGAVNIDEVLPVFQQALHDAGIDAIIECKQNQLDTWLASK